MFGKGLWGISVKKNPQLLFQVQQQLFTLPERNYSDFVVCAFDSNHGAKIVKERIYQDPCHWQDVLPKLTTFWRVCILPEIRGRWYTRKCDLSCKVQQTLAGICFCRMPSDANTVKCCNPDCPFIEFHPSCLASATPLPKRWYCPHCCRLPQFKCLRAAPKTKHGKISSAIRQITRVITRVSHWKFSTWPVSVTRKCRTTARPLGSVTTARK